MEFRFFRPYRKHTPNCPATNLRHLKIIDDSIELLKVTLNPSTFFGRCDDIAFSEEQINGKPSVFRDDAEFHSLIQIDFIDRLAAADRLSALKEYESRLTDAARKHYLSLI